MNVTPGTRLGRYEVRGSLGAGGMGEVYLAYDPELEREVAVKVLRDGVDDSAVRVRRFVQEAKAASALDHPNVAHVYEIDRVDRRPPTAFMRRQPREPQRGSARHQRSVGG